MTTIRFFAATFALILAAGIADAGKPAKGAYPFAVAPEKALDKLVTLDKVSGQKYTVTKDEASLFADARDGKLDEVSFANACLLASGVTDRQKLRSYLEKLDEIEAAARKAVANTKNVSEKARCLLEFLHAGPMAEGYESNQTDLHVVLDTGKFNCVSSAALYNVIGRRLGLDLKAVEIPEHVFSVLCDGDDRIDIETTNAKGFDPSDKEPSKKPITKAQRHAKERREVGEAGLAAVIAYNHGVTLSREKQFHAAVSANFRALALDAANACAAKNAVADLCNWPLELVKMGEYENALTVLALGLELAPTDSSLKNNHKVVWAEFADSRMKAGKPEEAVAILRRAAKAGTGEDFETRQAYLFAGPAQELMDAAKWDEALSLIDAGLKAVDVKAQKKLGDVRINLFLQWSHEELKKDQFEKALAVLKRAEAKKDGRITNNTLAVYDTWADSHMKRSEWSEAIRVYEQGLKQLPGNSHLTNNLAYCRDQMKK